MVITIPEAYGTLGLPLGASLDAIRNSYKNLALECHPDKNNQSQDSYKKFNQVSCAFRRLTLTDEKEATKALTKEEMFDLFQQVFFGKIRTKQHQHTKKNSSDSDEDEDEEEESFRGAKPKKIKEKTFDKNNFTNCVKEDSSKKIPLSPEEALKNEVALLQEEERERKKAEKRRAKKKRRKEKKKLEKAQQNEVSSIHSQSNNKSKNENIDSSEDSSESEEGLDPNSAFVAVAANKNKLSGIHNKLVKSEKTTTHKDTKENTNEQQTVENIDPQVLQGRILAMKGNEMANMGSFQPAVELFSDAIKMDPKDYRFFGNRSFCYDKLGQFHRALKDAERAIQLNPKWAKGYYRKGRALAGLKEYTDAEVAFEEVLKLDKNCEEAVQELLRVRSEQLREMGFTKQQAEVSIRQNGTVQSALDSLLSGVENSNSANEIYISDDESYMNSQKQHLQQGTDDKMNPRNPLGLKSLWVGNVSPEVQEKDLKLLFAKYGVVTSIRLIPEKFCAFVNYNDKTSAGKAMEVLQHHPIGGQHLLIRFPNNPITDGQQNIVIRKTKPVTAATQASSQAKQSGPVNGNECYFWRTTGCIYGDKCRYKHVKEHKGIDRKAWQQPTI